jgi:hypothetical protein
LPDDCADAGICFVDFAAIERPQRRLTTLVGTIVVEQMPASRVPTGIVYA